MTLFLKGPAERLASGPCQPRKLAPTLPNTHHVLLSPPFTAKPAETLKGEFSPAVAGQGQPVLWCGEPGWEGLASVGLGEASTEPGRQPFLSLPLSKGRQGKTCFYK